MLDKNWLSDWAQFQRSRSREKRKKLPLFEGVMLVHFGRQIEVNLYIEDERIEIRSVESNTIICADDINGYSSENSSIRITLRPQSSYYNFLGSEGIRLVFGNEDSHIQALEIITKMANAPNNLVETPPSSDDSASASSSSNDSSETSSSSADENCSYALLYAAICNK